MSLPQLLPEQSVLALTVVQKLVNTAAKGNEDRLVSIPETMFLAEDIT